MLKFDWCTIDVSVEHISRNRRQAQPVWSSGVARAAAKPRDYLLFDVLRSTLSTVILNNYISNTSARPWKRRWQFQFHI
jgi:hypothetical protein